MTRYIGSCMLLILLYTSAARGQEKEAQTTETIKARSDSLNRLVAVCDSTWDADDSAMVQAMSTKGSYPVRALATAMLFRGDTARYWNQFKREFAVHDYVPRAAGEHNMTSQAKMLEEFEAIQAAHPDIADNRVRVLLMFAHVRDANEWVDIRDQRVSMSRFFRTTFLADLFSGYPVDPMAVQSTMDQQTEAEDMKK